MQCTKTTPGGHYIGIKIGAADIIYLLRARLPMVI